MFSFKGKVVPAGKFKFDHFKPADHVPEPSDIVYDKETNHFFVTSNHGKLFETDMEGKVMRKAQDEGMDFEGVEVKDSFIYVADETSKKIYKYRKSDLSLVKVYQPSWGGFMNRALASITYNYSKKCFLLVSREPASIVEFDDNFKEISHYPFHVVQDVSGARWYKDGLYLLSNKDGCIVKCDANTYEPSAKYNINVLDPTGLAFDADNNVSVTSSVQQKIYYFKNLPNITQ